jgi:hypothetical protein
MVQFVLNGPRQQAAATKRNLRPFLDWWPDFRQAGRVISA